MADNEVTVKDETEGAGTANVDTKSVIGVGGKTVHRQVVSIGDPDTFGQEATVNAGGELLVKQTDAISISGTVPVSLTEPISVDDNAGSLTVDGTVTANAGTGPFPVSDNSGSLTVDAPVGTPVANRLSDGIAFLTTTGGRLSVDASGVAVPVTDNAGSLTIDGNVGLTAAQTLGTVTNLVQQNGVAISLNTGVRDTGTQRVTIATNDVVPVTDNAGSLTVDNAGTFAVQDAGLQKFHIRNSGDTLSATVRTDNSDGQATENDLVTEARLYSWNGASYDRVRSTNTGLLNIEGAIAHDAVDSGNPNKIGGQARQTNPTAVADADRVNAIFDDIGRQVIIQNQVRDLVVQQTTTISTTTETTILAAGAAGVFHDIVLLTIANTSATATRIDFRDITAGAVIFSLYVPAGATIGFAPPVPVKQTTAANVWSAQLGTAVTDIRIFVQGVKNV